MVKTRLKFTVVLLAVLVGAAGWFAYTNSENNGTHIALTATGNSKADAQLTITYGYNNINPITKTVNSPWHIDIYVTKTEKVRYLNLRVVAPTAYPQVACTAQANGKHSAHSPRSSAYGVVDCSGVVLIN